MIYTTLSSCHLDISNRDLKLCVQSDGSTDGTSEKVRKGAKSTASS
jgi:hypothetical protein